MTNRGTSFEAYRRLVTVHLLFRAHTDRKACHSTAPLSPGESPTKLVTKWIIGRETADEEESRAETRKVLALEVKSESSTRGWPRERWHYDRVRASGRITNKNVVQDSLPTNMKRLVVMKRIELPSRRWHLLKKNKFHIKRMLWYFVTTQAQRGTDQEVIQT